ncbi:3-phosphoinositide dependent protein kinase-1 [Entomortierella parvispora]|uniref:non-specific serine/threonine protein kinase n=1 Tax=Entomortierella parvispora TaxID=205924 RepID=A0A9P3LZ36_9FUNG|nr:3-phosphoinositide dependent protein kinase-1 [Entomortierella parvispora]
MQITAPASTMPSTTYSVTSTVISLPPTPTQPVDIPLAPATVDPTLGTPSTPIPQPSLSVTPSISTDSSTNLHGIISSPTGTAPVRKRTLADYKLGRTLGEGSYSTVVAAVDVSNKRDYAIKVLDKRHIIREKKVKYVNIEKNTLYKLDHPGVVKLYSTFQDSSSLYYVLELCQNGELLTFIKKLGSFDENCTRFYAAQILTAVEYIHSQGVIHRDLKPENILLDQRMYVKLTDFGTAKMLEPSEDGTDSDRANSFVGTAEYVSPELLTEKAACKSSDLWALGCIIYQLLTGRPPFKGSNEYQTFQKIVKLEYSFPPGFPAAAMDLVSKLLVHDPNDRLGANNTIGLLKQHPFFNGINWADLWEQPAPRLQPYTSASVPSTISSTSPNLLSEAEAGNGFESMRQLGDNLDTEDTLQGTDGNGNNEVLSSNIEDAGILFGEVNKTTPSLNTFEDLPIASSTSSNEDGHRPLPINRDGNSAAKPEHKVSSGRNPVLRWLSKISKGSKGKKSKKAVASTVNEKEHAANGSVEHNEKQL